MKLEDGEHRFSFTGAEHVTKGLEYLKAVRNAEEKVLHALVVYE